MRSRLSRTMNHSCGGVAGDDERLGGVLGINLKLKKKTNIIENFVYAKRVKLKF